MTEPFTLTADFTAAAGADVERRTIRGLALPYGVQGRTSRGRVTVEPGAIAIPSDLRRVKLYRDHRNADGTGTPVGYLADSTDDTAGLTVAFKVGPGDDGDAALSDAAHGVRDALSVELSGVQLSPDGTRVVRATLDAVALVAIPAFDDARVSSVTATATTTPGEDTTMTAPINPAAAPAAPADPPAEPAAAPATPPAPAATAPAAQPPELVAAATGDAPATAPASLRSAVQVTPRGPSFQDICDRLQAARFGGPDTLTAALQDITRTANPWVSPAGWVGELWSGVAYQREIVPLLTAGRLTNWKLTGWRWINRPEVDDYAGDKAEIPSNPVSTESVPVEAKRLAGGHDIDRKYFDFNDQEFIASYFRAMTESYAYESDQRAAAFVVASATAAGTAPTLLKAVAKGARSVKTLSRARATFALVNPTDLDTLLDVTNDDVPAFLSLLGINPESFTASDFVAAGTVIVGAKPAATFYELPGSPIRVEAVDIARGGRDGAVFGYYATLLHSAKGIAKVTIVP